MIGFLIGDYVLIKAKNFPKWVVRKFQFLSAEKIDPL